MSASPPRLDGSHPVLVPIVRHKTTALNDADIDRFATLFTPATPPATPTATSPPATTMPASRPRKTTQGSPDSDFGAFVSVPPAQDPLAAQEPPPPIASTTYFDRFTASARRADERSRRDVLDELLRHQDDPMYFLDRSAPAPAPDPAVGCAVPIPISTDDALAEALASSMDHFPHGSLKLSPSRPRIPPPRVSDRASPPSVSSPSGSSSSLVGGSPPLGAPAQATLSRISSSLVSLLPTRPRSRSSMAPSPTPTPTPFGGARHPYPELTHGSPFASTPYIPPTGAPGFTGDRAWDRGFSETLEREEKAGLVDPIGLGCHDPHVHKHAHPHGHGHGHKHKGVVLVGRREGTVGVLTPSMADLIRPHLSPLLRLPTHWTLLYSLDQHGISLNTLYARCAPAVPSRAHPNPPQGGLVVLRDERGTVFGAWVSEGVRRERGGYYGTGDAFLWRYRPDEEEGEGEGEGEGWVDAYVWTGANAYVALCEPGFLSFGGGDGRYGLYLDASLLDGSSAPCPTFGNPALCARSDGEREKEVAFECVGLEVWGVGSGPFS